MKISSLWTNLTKRFHLWKKIRISKHRRLWASPGKIESPRQNCCAEPTCHALRHLSWNQSCGGWPCGSNGRRAPPEDGLLLWPGYRCAYSIRHPLKSCKHGLKLKTELNPIVGWETLTANPSAWRMAVHKGVQGFLKSGCTTSTRPFGRPGSSCAKAAS